MKKKKKIEKNRVHKEKNEELETLDWVLEKKRKRQKCKGQRAIIYGEEAGFTALELY